MSGMEWAILLKAPFMFLLAALVLYPARKAVQKWMPEGRLKRLLLRRVN